MRSIAFLIVAGASTSVLAQPPAPSKNVGPTEIEVTSPAFPANGAIPKMYSCEGKSISPPLAWSNIPARTQSIAILVEDPDAPNGTFTHWVVSGLPPTQRSLPAGAALPSGAIAGKNDKGNRGFTPPCPPSGMHRYHFRVFALDVPDTATSKAELMALVNTHEIAEGELVGTFSKGGGA